MLHKELLILTHPTGSITLIPDITHQSGANPRKMISSKASQVTVLEIQAFPFPSPSLCTLTAPFCMCIILDPLYLNCISSFVLEKKREEERRK